MDFSEAIQLIKKCLSAIGSEINENSYDGFIVKKLELSNTLIEGRTTNQTHIAITGEQMDLFPYVRADGYFEIEYDKEDSDLKKYFVAQIPVYLHKENIMYLEPNANITDESKQLVHVSIVRSRRKDSSDQVQMSMINIDSPQFVTFRKLITAKSYMVLLKYKSELLYDLFCIKEMDAVNLLHQLNNKFFKLPTNTIVKIDELVNQYKELSNNTEKLQLSSSVRECAQSIVNEIYNIDGFKKLIPYFDITEKVVKINTNRFLQNINNGNFLGYVFIRPQSDMYSINPNKRVRVFEKEYLIVKDSQNYKFRLSTEWKNSEPTSGDNYLKTLVEVVNVLYSEYLSIKEENGIYYILRKSNEFKIPNLFNDSFSSRYIISLLAKPFVILTGNSGTGKTRIAKQFSQYLEEDINGKKNWLIVPVGADWTDNTKMLGFYNPLEERYVSTPTLDFILQACENPSIPHFLILDEMNLSHVERYFSDFLSAMESDEEIPLYKKSVKKENTEEYEDAIPEKIHLPKNLFVTGTVNIDETTYMFSPKVLDRSNVVEFKPEKDDVLELMTGESDVNIIEAADFGVAEGFTAIASEIRNGVCNVDMDVLEKVKLFLDGIYDELQESGFEFAYRTVKEIRQYFAAACELQKEDFNLTRTMDEQIVQKILPKIYGDRKQIGELLDTLEEKCKNGIEDSSEEMTLSLKKIEQMKKRLDKYQYASFM